MRYIGIQVLKQVPTKLDDTRHTAGLFLARNG
jgi:hypothetical protein